MSDDPPKQEEISSVDKEKRAVALQYDKGEDIAPRVTATGKGSIAEQIIAIAEENGITIRQDKELTEILSVLEVDSVIPLEAYAAVAEILSYIYRTNANSRK